MRQSYFYLPATHTVKYCFVPSLLRSRSPSHDKCELIFMVEKTQINPKAQRYISIIIIVSICIMATSLIFLIYVKQITHQLFV